MTIYEHIADIDNAKDHLKNNQDSVLDMFDKNNSEHARLLNEMNKLLAELEELEQEFQSLLSEEEDIS